MLLKKGNKKINRKINIAFFLANFLVFGIFSYFIMKVDSNSVKAILKGSMMFFVFLLAFLNFKFLDNNKKNDKYKIYILLAISSSLLSDVTIEFNFIIGGIFSLFSVILLSVSFLSYFKFNNNKLLKRNLDIHDIFFMILTSLFIFSIFMIFSSIFSFPKISNELSMLKILFPIYMFLFSFSVGASFLAKAPNMLKFGIILFFISDTILFYNVCNGFTLISSFLGLLIYFAAENIFALES